MMEGWAKLFGCGACGGSKRGGGGEMSWFTFLAVLSGGAGDLLGKELEARSCIILIASPACPARCCFGALIKYQRCFQEITTTY